MIFGTHTHTKHFKSTGKSFDTQRNTLLGFVVVDEGRVAYWLVSLPKLFGE